MKTEYETSAELKDRKLHENYGDLLIKKILDAVSSSIKGTAPQI